MKHPWTNDEQNFLIENYPKYGGEYCIKHLPAKTLSSIHNKVFSLKLKYTSQTRDISKNNLLKKINKFGTDKIYEDMLLLLN